MANCTALIMPTRIWSRVLLNFHLSHCLGIVFWGQFVVKLIMRPWTHQDTDIAPLSLLHWPRQSEAWPIRGLTNKRPGYCAYAWLLTNNLGLNQTVSAGAQVHYKQQARIMYEFLRGILNYLQTLYSMWWGWCHSWGFAQSTRCVPIFELVTNSWTAP